jgi:hypothetical protein
MRSVVATSPCGRWRGRNHIDEYRVMVNPAIVGNESGKQVSDGVSR